MREDHEDLLDSDHKREVQAAREANLARALSAAKEAVRDVEDPSPPIPDIPGLFCMNCAGKHLAKAADIFQEILTGSWNDARHRMFLRGNLGNAEDHLGPWTLRGKRCRSIRIEIEKMLYEDILDRDPGDIIIDILSLYTDVENRLMGGQDSNG